MKNAGSILLSVACFADPTGAASVAIHALRGAKIGAKIIANSKKMNKLSKAFKKVFKGGAKPPNLTPDGARRKGAFRKAKRNSGIPVSEQPKKVTQAVDKRGNRIPGKDYNFGNGKVIRDHSGGHKFPDDPTHNRGPHFNDPKGNHYDY